MSSTRRVSHIDVSAKFFNPNPGENTVGSFADEDFLEKVILKKAEKTAVKGNYSTTMINVLLLFQGVLLHPDGEIREASCFGRCKERG